jgi:4-hydroxy-3-methylbut-2-en-1-yl diphosphate reductase
MKILLAEHSGFCFGVRRAVQMALDAKNEDGDVCTMGELIHNPQVVNELARQGIEVCENLRDIRNKTVVIRSHGISKNEFQTLRDSENKIIDATCPYVKRAQELVASNSQEHILIMGDPAHPEVRGMLSYGGKFTQVVPPQGELPVQNWKKLFLISQTTQKLSNLQDLVCHALPRVLELTVFNTICSATTLRQESALALAGISELMFVIGGRNSSNTRMLQQLCSSQTKSVHIETEAEIDPAMLSAAQSIGLAAGASTPAEAIIKVFNKIKKIKGEAGTARQIEDIPLFKEESCRNMMKTKPQPA